MNPLALELVCNFLTDDPNLWKQDVQDLASLAKTCKQASEACGPLVEKHRCLETDWWPERRDPEKEWKKWELTQEIWRKGVDQEDRQRIRREMEKAGRFKGL
jgi:hypothetical protein